MNVTAEHKKAKREQILSEGLCLMHAKGYNGTGVKDITDAAGIPKGSFYNYFASKEDFALAAMKFYYDTYVESRNKALSSQELPPLERLKQHFEYNRKAIVEDQGFAQGCFINNMCQEMADQSGPISKDICVFINKSRTAIIDCLAEAQQRGEVNASHDIKLLAQFIDNAWRGLVTTAKAEHSEAEFDGFMHVVFNHLIK